MNNKTLRKVGNFLVFSARDFFEDEDDDWFRAINIDRIIIIYKVHFRHRITESDGESKIELSNGEAIHIRRSVDEILEAIDQDDVQEGGVVPCSAWETCQCEKCVIERKEGAKKTDAKTAAMGRLVMELLQDPAIEWNVCHWERNLSDERRICYEYEKHSSRYWANIGVRDRSHDTFYVNAGPEPHGSWALNRTGTFKELFWKFQDKIQMTADTGGCYHTKKAL